MFGRKAVFYFFHGSVHHDLAATTVNGNIVLHAFYIINISEINFKEFSF